MYGIPEILILSLVLWLVVRLAKKAGHSGWWALLIFTPPPGIGLLIIPWFAVEIVIKKNRNRPPPLP